MAYGIEILGSELQYQVDSSTTSTSYLVVAANSTTTESSYPYMIKSSDSWSSSDIVFARPTSGSGRFYSHFIISSPTYPRPSFNVPTEYLILRPSASASVDSTLDYGIQIKNDATSSVVIFDSRSSIGGGTSIKGLNIVSSHPRNSLLGGQQAASSLNTTNRLVYDSTSGNWDKVYVSVSAGIGQGDFTGIFYDGINTSGSGGGIINGFFYDNVGYNVLFEGFNVRNGAPAPRANTGTILAGLVKS
tara:strand:- start:480 stop:1217 length:738 start_codon:yes stop_codon:yes gene_type:complete